MAKKDIKKQKKTGRIIKICICVFLAFILAGLIFIAVEFDSLLGKINYVPKDVTHSTLSSSEYDDFMKETDPIDPDYTGPITNEEDVEWDDGPEYIIGQDQSIINILLIGQDRRPGETRARSDSMILCTINKTDKTITLTSFLRDLYVQIPGYQDNRINASYFLGGFPLLNQCIEKNFGVHIDGNVEVDFSGFQKIVDRLGGVDIELTAAEASYLNRRGNWDVNNSTAWQWNLTAGMNHLTGEQALAYSRIRQVGYTGDFGRTDRQKNVLNALCNKINGISLSQLYELLNELLPMITTDLTEEEILSYAYQTYQLLDEIDTLGTLRIPADNTYDMTMIRGMSVLLPDLVENRKLLEEIMKP